MSYVSSRRAFLFALGLAGASAWIAPEARSDTTMCAGLFKTGGGGARAAWIGKKWDNFHEKWVALEKDGYRMTDFETYLDDGTRKYAGLFEKASYAPAAIVGVEWSAFHTEWAKQEKRGYRIKDLEVYNEGGKTLFAAIFEPGTWVPAAVIGVEWPAFHAEWVKQEKQNYRLYDFETYVQNGKRLYAGLFKPGTYAPAAIIGVEWTAFEAEIQKQGKLGLRLFDVEVYDVGNKRLYAGLFKPETGAHAVWIGRDWESFTAQWHALKKQGMQLFDLELYSSACDGACSNTIVMPPCDGDPDCGYDYQITATKTHCEGAPGSCPTPAAGATAHYRWPVDVEGGDRYLHISAVDFSAPAFFTLPFKDESSMWHNGWRYGDGTWHHAIDYATDPTGTFKVRAAAPGTVVHVGWDNWSGNTVIVSHDNNGVKDAFRTIYMHLRNGAANDCDNAWTLSVPITKGDDKTNYKSKLDNTGCPKDKAKRKPTSANWGAKESIAVKPGDTVTRGQMIAWAGETGPGGNRNAEGKVNTHLHIFFARRDASGDNRWYFIDPYGIYGKPDCYPKGMFDAVNTPCARYPVMWKDGKPQSP